LTFARCRTVKQQISKMLLATQMICSVVCGVSLHLCYFIRGEHHLQSPTIFRIAILAPIIVFLVNFRHLDIRISDAAISSACVVASFASSLFTSMTVYRIFFHRTRKFPGPKLAGVTKLYHMWNVALKSDQYQWLEKMHQEYGSFVRTGTADISAIGSIHIYSS